MAKGKIWARIASILFILLCLSAFGYTAYNYWLSLNRSITNKRERAAITLQSALPQKKVRKTNEDLVSITVLTTDKVSSETESAARNLSVQTPYSKTKYVIFNEDKCPVEFNWTNESEKKVTITIYDAPEMKKAISSHSYTKVSSATENLAPGTYWWKITCGNEAGTGKITIINSQQPKLLSPAENYSTGYFSKAPDIRFSWSEASEADYYRLIIADNPQFNKPLVEKDVDSTTALVPAITKGSWYWKVTPYYSYKNIGFANESETSSFVVLQNATLEKAELLSPKAESIITTKISINNRKILYKPVYFTWKNNPEAEGYELKLWYEKAQGVPYISMKLTENYYRLNIEEFPLKNGNWFWQVNSIDSTGKAVSSDIQQFFTVEAQAEQKLIYPSNDYHLPENRTSSTRFSWKNNFPAMSTLQIATDEAFRNVIYTKATSGNSTASPYLAPGTYYWRIISTCEEETLTSQTRTLNIIEMLEAPELYTPKEGTREVVHNNIPVKFTWKTVPGADYYHFKLYTKNNPERIVYENSHIVAEAEDKVTHLLIMDNMAETTYIWTVQAYANEKPDYSKNISYLSAGSFRMRILKPVKLVLPLNGTSFDGIFAITDPANFVWSSIDTPVSSRIVIYKDTAEPENKYSTINKPKYTQKMPKLYEGQYYWTIVARTADDLDISALEMRNFNVKTMPKLPIPEMISPQDDLRINIEYIVENGLKINFNWGKMDGIARYIFRIFKKEDPSPLFEVELDPDTTEYTFEGEPFANTVGKYNGGWGWSVEAQSDFEGELLQRGATKIIYFDVDIPRNKPGDVAIQEEKRLRYGLGEDEELDPNIEKKLKNAKKSSDDKVQKTNKYSSKKTKKSK